MRLLLAEDDPDLVTILKKDLEIAGYAVDLADNGVDAEYLGNEMIYDVAVLDYSMPGKNGLELASELEVLIPETTVILATGLIDSSELEQSRPANVKQVIQKPFDI